jgi:hypothetical protein
MVHSREALLGYRPKDIRDARRRQRSRVVRGANANFYGRHALRALRWSYCAFIAAASITAAQSALHGHREGAQGPQFVLALGVTETMAAIAFAIEPVEVIGCAALLLVYCVAGVVSAVSADWVAILRFIFYAVTAAYIVLASRASR